MQLHVNINKNRATYLGLSTMSPFKLTPLCLLSTVFNKKMKMVLLAQKPFKYMRNCTFEKHMYVEHIYWLDTAHTSRYDWLWLVMITMHIV